MNETDLPPGARQQLLNDIATYGRCYWNNNGERLNPIVIERDGPNVSRRFRRDDEADYSYTPPALPYLEEQTPA